MFCIFCNFWTNAARGCCLFADCLIIEDLYFLAIVICRVCRLLYQWNRGISTGCTTVMVWECHSHEWHTHPETFIVWTAPGDGVDNINDTRTEGYIGNASKWQNRLEIRVQRQDFEERRFHKLEAKRDLLKSGPPSTSSFQCQICQRKYRSRTGLTAHSKWWDLSHRRLSP